MITLLITGIILALAVARFGIKILRIAFNLLPVIIGVTCAVYLMLIKFHTLALIVILASLYLNCPWWEFWDEALWMKKGVCSRWIRPLGRRIGH